MSSVIYTYTPMHTIIEQVCDQYLNPKNAWMYEREVHLAMDEFLGAAKSGPLPEAALSFFADWFVFDFPMFGTQTPLMRFFEMNPLNLSSDELGACKRIIDTNRYDFFEVIRNSSGNIRIRSVRNAEEFDVLDPTMQCPVGDVFASRIINAGGGWRIASIDPIGLPSPSKKDKARMKSEFPVLDSRIVYQEIVALGDADMEIPLGLEKVEGDLVVSTGGNAHADDGCAVCVLLERAKKEKRTPTEKEIIRAFKEAGQKKSKKLR